MGCWTYTTHDLHDARFAHTATLLPDGRVLVAGGHIDFPGGSTLNTAELYNPATETWTDTDSLGTARYRHTATLLPNGTVLVAVGLNDFAGILTSAELYDPMTGSWTSTPPPTPRAIVPRRRCCPTARCWW